MGSRNNIVSTAANFVAKSHFCFLGHALKPRILIEKPTKIGLDCGSNSLGKFPSKVANIGERAAKTAVFVTSACLIFSNQFAIFFN
ncbi:hypothetical protein MAH1_03410 [Sessilibacter sp. MAH1]